MDFHSIAPFGAGSRARGGTPVVMGNADSRLPQESFISATKQKTLKSSIGCTGVGLHSGKRVSITLHPADSGTGIVLRRTDVALGEGYIPVTWRNVVDTKLATTVGNDCGVTVATVEHLMAALAGCEIDNAFIDVDGPELPIMDGSAAPFVFLIECAGTVVQAAPRRAIKVNKPVIVGDDDNSLSLMPADRFSVRFQIDFDASVIACQELTVHLTDGAFKTDIARARTFGFEHEVDRLRDAGLALGGSLDNAIVISGGEVLNEDGLRYRDEFVRHKILDCIGDLYMAGAPIIGYVHGVRSGHALNQVLLNRLFAERDAWSYVSMADIGFGDANPFEDELEEEVLAATA